MSAHVMTSFALLLKLESEDFSVDVRDGDIWIAPGSALTPEQRALVVEFKRKLLALFASKIDSKGCCSVCRLNVITFDGLCEVDFDRQCDAKEGVAKCLSQNKPVSSRQTRKANFRVVPAQEQNLF